jgi:hypothetical protein
LRRIRLSLSQSGKAGGSGQIVDIVLPYSAFDLNLIALIVGNTTRYFPLKQAQNAVQYTLSRTFSQEVYVIADYEHRNFLAAQALFLLTSVSQNIVLITAPSQSQMAMGLSMLQLKTQGTQELG